ncbi:hypothetical protein A2U01_0052340, partial [Trifolium medium]|nr:hypothetical protein [Trifolium medium]
MGWGDEDFVEMRLRRERYESNEWIATAFPSMNAQILHNFPCWRAAPSLLRDAQVAVTPFQLEFLYWRTAPDILRYAQLPEV